MPTGIRIPLDKLKVDLMSGQHTQEELARKYKVHISTIQRNAIKIRRKPDLFIGPAQAAATITPPHPGGRPKGVGKYKHLLPQMLALKEQKFTQAEIGRKLNMKPGTVGYYLAPRRKYQFTQLGKEQTNGHINKNIALGIAYAETERFIGVLAQRLAFAPAILRQRLSELLGHSPLRADGGLND